MADVTFPDGTVVSFPDSMSADDITRTIKKDPAFARFSSKSPIAPVAPDVTQGLNSLFRGFPGGLGSPAADGPDVADKGAAIRRQLVRENPDLRGVTGPGGQYRIAPNTSMNAVQEPGIMERATQFAMAPFTKGEQMLTSALLQSGIGERGAIDRYRQAQELGGGGVAGEQQARDATMGGGLFNSIAPETMQTIGSLPYGIGGVASTAASLLTPSNLALMALMPAGGIGRAAGVLFGAPMVAGGLSNVGKSFEAGDFNQYVGGLLGTTLGGLGLYHSAVMPHTPGATTEVPAGKPPFNPESMMLPRTVGPEEPLWKGKYRAPEGFNPPEGPNLSQPTPAAVEEIIRQQQLKGQQPVSEPPVPVVAPGDASPPVEAQSAPSVPTSAEGASPIEPPVEPIVSLTKPPAPPEEVPTTPVVAPHTGEDLTTPESPAQPAELPLKPAPTANETSIKNAQMDAEHEAMGLPTVEPAPWMNEEDAMAAGEARHAADPNAGRLLAEELAARPRPHTAEEAGLLTAYKADVLAKHKALLREHTAAVESGDTERAAQLRQQADSLEDHIVNVLSPATRHSGTALSEAFNARKGFAVVDDSNPADVIDQAQLNRGDSPLPDPVKRDIEKTALEIGDLNDAIKAKEENLSSAEAAKQADKANTEGAKSRALVNARKAADIDQKIAAAYDRLMQALGLKEKPVVSLTKTPESTPAEAVGTPTEGKPQTAGEVTPKRKRTQKQAPVVLPDQSASHIKGAAGTAFTSDNTPVKFHYAAVDSGNLITSHSDAMTENPSYDQSLQPRDRTRAASDVQVREIAQKLNPDRVGENAGTWDGAPVIGPDNQVESGNARSIAIRRNYAEGNAKAQEYRDWLKANAAKFGLDPDAIDGMKNPVLVRVREGEAPNRRDLAEKMGKAPVAAMSETETARADARRVLDLGLMDKFVPNESGNVASLANQDFIRAFVGSLDPSERAGVLADDGTLSAPGVRRVRNAILAAAYDDTATLQRMIESTDDNVRATGNALLKVAPNLVRLKDLISRGERYDADISGDLTDAVNTLSYLRERGIKLPQYFAQGAMFDEGLSPVGEQLLTIMDKYKNSAKNLTNFINTYLAMVEDSGNPNQSVIFDPKDPPNKAEFLRAAEIETDRANANGKENPTGNIFAQDENRPSEGQENSNAVSAEASRTSEAAKPGTTASGAKLGKPLTPDQIKDQYIRSARKETDLSWDLDVISKTADRVLALAKTLQKTPWIEAGKVKDRAALDVMKQHDLLDIAWNDNGDPHFAIKGTEVPSNLMDKAAADAREKAEAKPGTRDKGTRGKGTRSKGGFADIASPGAEGSPSARFREAAPIVKELLQLHAQKGAITLDEFVRKVQEQIPELSARMIHDAISGYGDFGKDRPRSAKEERIASLEREAHLTSKLEDERAGIDTRVPKSSSKSVNPDHEEILKEIAQLRRERQQRAALEDVQDQLRTGNYRQRTPRPKGTQTPLEQELANARKQLSTAKARQAHIDRLTAEVRDLEEQATTGNIKPPKLRQTRPTDPELDALYQRRRQAKEKIRNIVEAQKPGSTLDKVTLAMRAGMISGPLTYTKILLSHGSYLAAEEARRVPAAIMDAARSRITGADRTTAGIDPRAMWKSATEAATSGVKDAATILRHGDKGLEAARAARGDQSLMAKWETDASATHSGKELNGPPLISHFVNGTMRLHGAMYEVMKHYALTRALHEQATVAAMNMRKNGALGGQTFEEARDHLFNNPTPEMQANAIAAAEVATFINKNKFSTAVSNAKRGMSPAYQFGLDALIPFPKVPANVAGRTFEYSPAGLPVAMTKALYSGIRKTFTEAEWKEFNDTFSRSSTGIGLMALGYVLASKGLMNTTDWSKEKGRHQDPGTVEIMGRKFKLAGVAPVGNITAFGADLYHTIHGPNRKASAAMTKAVMALFGEQPLLSSIENNARTLDDAREGKVWPAIGKQVAGRVVPGALAQPAAMMDKDTPRQQNTIADTFKYRIPKMRETLKQKTYKR